MPRAHLKFGREKSLLRLHPWVFSGAIAHLEGECASGETVEVVAADGRLLGLGAWSPQSQIRVRIWSFDGNQVVDGAFFGRRLRRALDNRRDLAADAGAGLRLVNAESDGLPGVVVDRYGGWLVCQFLGAGAERWKQTIVDELLKACPARGVYERSDTDSRGKEGLPPATGVLAGEPPPELVEVSEGPCRFLVDVRAGHKTGFYLDQRENRRAVAACSRDAEVLNVFSYTGGFGICALAAGCRSVVNVDSSAAALALADRNAQLSGLDASRMESVEADAFALLRTFRDAGRSFDLIVLDPPKFVDSRVQLERGCRGYKDINLQAFKLLRPGGLLFTFSCSGLLPAELFQKIVADAALDARREAQIVTRLGQAADHPVLLSFPEGAYLKGLMCRAW